MTKGAIQTEQQQPRGGRIDLWEKIRGMKSIDRVCLSENDDGSQGLRGEELLHMGAESRSKGGGSRTKAGI